jgi:hypothetical protein
MRRLLFRARGIERETAASPARQIIFWQLSAAQLIADLTQSAPSGYHRRVAS